MTSLSAEVPDEPDSPLVRPEPAASRSSRVSARIGSVVERLRARTEASEQVTQQPLVLVGVAAVGAALLAVGLLWGWQSWSNRSAVPVDDLLPRLVESDRVGARDPAAADEVGGSSSETDMDANDNLAVEARVEVAVTELGERPLTDLEGALGLDEPTPEPLVVHVAGAVAQPGVVELGDGSRVFHAVEAAGGAEATADLDRVNLAAVVVDGERLWIPTIGEESPPVLVATDRSAAPMSSMGVEASAAGPTDIVIDLVDINRASLLDLQTLPGIGPALAQAVVTTRLERGPFLSVEELVDVAGIGPATLERLRPFVVVRPPTSGG